jgi:hypothetical protein
MKASIAINLIWEIAAQEAIAGQFGEISPEHFFMGLLKLSELNPDRVGQIVDDESDVQIINSEIEQIKRYLHDVKINSTTARRNLRVKFCTVHKKAGKCLKMLKVLLKLKIAFI